MPKSNELDVLKNITEEQRNELALFAKNLLETTGVTSAIKGLNGCISDTASGSESTSCEIDKTLLFCDLQRAYINLMERAMEQKKSIFALTGVIYDDVMYGLDERKEK